MCGHSENPKSPNRKSQVTKRPIGWLFGHWDSEDNRGSVSVEMIFFAAFFALLFFGAVELAREVALKHSLDVGTYRAARYLSLVPDDTATAKQMIQAEVASNVLGSNYGSGVRMSVDMPDQKFQSIFTVTASLNYQPVIPFMIFAPKTLQTSHSQSIERYP